MKIVVTPDSFKGSLTAIEVSDAIEHWSQLGIMNNIPDFADLAW